MRTFFSPCRSKRLAMRSLVAWALPVLVWVGVGGTSAPARAQTDKIAVLPLLAYGVPSDRVSLLEQRLASAVGRASGDGVLGQEDTRLLLDAAESAANCSRDKIDCLVLIGKLMAVRQLVAGTVQRTDGGYEVVLRVVDVTTGREDRRVSGSLRGGRTEAAEDLERLTHKLYNDKSAQLGGLSIQIHEEGALVYVDEKLIGASPLAGPLFGLHAGKHKVKVTLEGQDPVERDVIIAPAAVVEIQLRVIPEAPEVVTVTEGVAEEEVSGTSLAFIYTGFSLMAVGALPLVGGVLLALGTFLIGMYAAGAALLPLVPTACDAAHGENASSGCAATGIGRAVQLYRLVVPFNWIGLVLAVVGVVVTGAGIGSSITGWVLSLLVSHPHAEEGGGAGDKKGTTSLVDDVVGAVRLRSARRAPPRPVGQRVLEAGAGGGGASSSSHTSR